jgi:uncharacterized protein (TIGR00255 family)
MKVDDMVRSMTGFASDFRSTNRYDITMEIKSVNSRYFEFKLKSPQPVDAFENDIKNVVFEKLRRGKIDFFLRVVEKDAENYQVVVNLELGRKYRTALASLAREVGVTADMNLRDFVSLPHMLEVERKAEDEELSRTLLAMTESVVDKVLEMMYVEGKRTQDDIEASLAAIRTALAAIEKIYPEALEKYKKNLTERISELVGQEASSPLASNRILMEVELVASRTAINEEIVRLGSHIQQFEAILSGKAKGDSKKLDFIGQEMNRETNTIASKSSDYGIVENTIVIKGEIEKIREQLRNLE